VGFVPKPVKGTATRERRQKVDKHHRSEQDEMTATKKLDGYKCRRPGCKNKTMAVQCAHLEHRGPGGNPDGSRTKRHKLITLCIEHHSMFDRHDMAITPLTEKGTRGPCEFRWRDGRSGELDRYALERTYHVSETRT
jgi:hypothetical protein